MSIVKGAISTLKERIKNLEDTVTCFLEGRKAQNEVLKFKRAVESSGEAIFITDVNGLITYVNPEFEEIYGYASDEVIGKATPRVLKSGIMNPKEYESFWNTILSKQIVRGEFINKKKDGSLINIEGSANAILNRKNEIVGFLAIQRDITERKQTEESLRESEEKYRELIQELSDSIVIYVEGKIVFINNQCLRLMRASTKEELIGKSLLEFVHPIYWDFIKDYLSKTLKERFSLPLIDLKFIRIDGSIIDVEVKITPIIFGKTPAVQVLINDITERKLAGKALAEANQLNKQIIQSAREGIIVYDRNLKFQVWNPFMENLTGIPASDVLGKHPDDLFPVLKDLEVKCLIERSLQGEIIPEVDFEFNIPVSNKSGWVSDFTAPLINSTGEIIGVIRTVRDITIRKRAEQELICAKEKAEESDRLKTSFLTNMSHEIRTPMNGISGFAQLLVRPSVTEEKRKLYSDTITKCCDQLTSIVNDIIDISKIETGQMTLIEETVNVNDLIRDLFNVHNKNALDKGISLKTFVSSKDEECLIYSDRLKLQQILNNLIGNAIKFTIDGYVKFGYVKTQSFLQFFVEDTGIGIAPEFHDKVFDRFRQVENGFSRNYDGAGLGLSISKSLVQLLGGEIWLNSIPGKGSTFNFSVTYNSSSENKDDKIKEEVVEFVGVPENTTILVVEDNSENYLYIAESMHGESFSLLHAWNGQEAVELCRSNGNIDVILMDIKMPVMDGFEAALQIKKIHPDIPIIAQTALAMLADKEKILKSGFDGYISKPILRNTLIETIKKFAWKYKVNKRSLTN